jgi:hypothetical protein
MHGRFAAINPPNIFAEDSETRPGFVRTGGGIDSFIAPSTPSVELLDIVPHSGWQ